MGGLPAALLGREKNMGRETVARTRSALTVLVVSADTAGGAASAAVQAAADELLVASLLAKAVAARNGADGDDRRLGPSRPCPEHEGGQTKIPRGAEKMTGR